MLNIINKCLPISLTFRPKLYSYLTLSRYCNVNPIFLLKDINQFKYQRNLSEDNYLTYPEVYALHSFSSDNKNPYIDVCTTNSQRIFDKYICFDINNNKNSVYAKAKKVLIKYENGIVLRCYIIGTEYNDLKFKINKGDKGFLLKENLYIDSRYSHYGSVVNSFGKLMNIKESIEPMENFYIKNNLMKYCRPDKFKKKIVSTGIKVIDLLFPMNNTGRYGMVGDKGIGKTKLIDEILYGLSEFSDIKTIICGCYSNYKNRIKRLIEYNLIRKNDSDIVKNQKNYNIILFNLNESDYPYQKIFGIKSATTIAYKHSETNDVLLVYENLNKFNDINQNIIKEKNIEDTDFKGVSFEDVLFGDKCENELKHFPDYLSQLHLPPLSYLKKNSENYQNFILEVINIKTSVLYNPTISPSALFPYLDGIIVLYPKINKNIKGYESLFKEKSIIDPLRTANRIISDININEEDRYLITEEHRKLAKEVINLFKDSEKLNILCNRSLWLKKDSSVYVGVENEEKKRRSDRLLMYLCTQKDKSFVKLNDVFEDCKKILSGLLDWVPLENMVKIESLKDIKNKYKDK